MISELVRNIIHTYESIKGDGRFITLFLVSVLFLYIIRTISGIDIVTFILSPLSCIAVAASRVCDFIKSRWAKLLGVCLILFVFCFSGDLIFSRDISYVADNGYHIPGDYIEVMDYTLSMVDNPKVMAMPDYSMYHEIYSSRFDMLFENRQGDDVRYLDEDARVAFTELSNQKPDMKAISDIARLNECDFIILKKNRYWPKYNLFEFDYEIVQSFENWDVYGRKGAVYE